MVLVEKECQGEDDHLREQQMSWSMRKNKDTFESVYLEWKKEDEIAYRDAVWESGLDLENGDLIGDESQMVVEMNEESETKMRRISSPIDVAVLGWAKDKF